MLAFCIGLALIVGLVNVFKIKAKVEGLLGIALFACVCYGVGSLVLMLFKLVKGD